MKVLYICGSYPPEKCANADTALIMVNLLINNGLEVEVLSNIDWSFRNIIKIGRIVRNIKADVIHVQYPGMGFRYSLVPQILSLFNRKKAVITIHEVSQVHFLRKLALLPFSFCSKLIFTNDYDRLFYLRIIPWTKKGNTRVVPIGSNIHVFKNENYKNKDQNRILYFGQIRPKKGLEEVIELARLINIQKINLEIVIVGRTYAEFKSYTNKLFEDSRNLPISWNLNLSEEDVSSLLGTIMFAYLPFPDGASERRGSLFATMAHHMVTFTTKSYLTPTSINSSVIFVKSPEDVLSAISNFDVQSVYPDIILNSDIFLKKYSWEKIIEDYTNIFESVLLKK